MKGIFNMAKKKYYAVKVGKTPGIYFTWADCSAQVTGFKGAKFKSFESIEEAENFINGNEVNKEPVKTQEIKKETPTKTRLSTKPLNSLTVLLGTLSILDNTSFILVNLFKTHNPCLIEFLNPFKLLSENIYSNAGAAKTIFLISLYLKASDVAITPPILCPTT